MLTVGSAMAQVNVRKAFQLADQQYRGMLKTHPDTSKMPHSSNANGSLRDMPSSWWGSGFFPGSLWYLYEYSKDPFWKKEAERWTAVMEKEKFNNTMHDLGFMMYCPFGNGYRLTKNPRYKDIIMTSAASLATRYDSARGVIKSWDKFTSRSKQYCDFPVIIDNMMNLEMMMWAARQSGNKHYSDLSISHADQTIKHHYRPDYSSYHVICYGPDGQPTGKYTAQGKADESPWARGQAWGLYGYVMMYRETKDKRYLEQADHIADFILKHKNMPADMVPFWDMDSPNEERDASAAAVIASALLELQQYVPAKAVKYRKAAEKMLTSLGSPAYTAKIGENNQFLLMHSTGHKMGNIEIDVPLAYADYYYLEALLRYQRMKAGKSVL